MNKTKFVISILSCSVVAHATEWKPSREFLHAVRYVESSNGKNQIGDNGYSLGDFQLSEAAWLDVNSWRRSRGLKTYQYDDSVFNGFISRVYASNYLTILFGELKRKLGRDPSHGELYAAYNMGLATFASCNYRLSRVNPVTREKCRQIGEILAAKSDS